MDVTERTDGQSDSQLCMHDICIGGRTARQRTTWITWHKSDKTSSTVVFWTFLSEINVDYYYYYKKLFFLFHPR